MSENVERNPDEGTRVGPRRTAQGRIAKSILINNAYLLAHRFFAEHVARRLCQAARDDLFEITSTTLLDLLAVSGRNSVVPPKYGVFGGLATPGRKSENR